MFDKEQQSEFVERLVLINYLMFCCEHQLGDPHETTTQLGEALIELANWLFTLAPVDEAIQQAKFEVVAQFGLFDGKARH